MSEGFGRINASGIDGIGRLRRVQLESVRRATALSVPAVEVDHPAVSMLDLLWMALHSDERR